VPFAVVLIGHDEDGAMEIHPGVFVTSTATREWRPDPEVGGGAEEHVLFDNGAMRAGLTRLPRMQIPRPHLGR
jgi:hypothetical protein